MLFYSAKHCTKVRETKTVVRPTTRDDLARVETRCEAMPFQGYVDWFRG